MLRALFIGRFSPFHNGHLKVIKEIAKECDEIIIGIGSAQENYTLENPFTAGERYLMIFNTLIKEDIYPHIIPIVDINRYAVWVSHVESFVPKFDVVFTNNALTRMLFEEKNYKVKGTALYDRKKYSSTEIRRRMLKDENWQALVPKAVEKMIGEIDGVKRIKGLVENVI